MEKLCMKRSVFKIFVIIAIVLVSFMMLVSCKDAIDESSDINESNTESQLPPINGDISIVIPNYSEENEETNAETENEDQSEIHELLYLSNGDGTCTLCGIGNIAERELFIPETNSKGEIVTSISPMAFYGCEDLVAVRIPMTVISIGENAFSDCRVLENIHVDPMNEYYRSVNGILYDKEGKTLIVCPDGYRQDYVTIEKTVTTIAPMAFYNCTNVKRIDYLGEREEWDEILIKEKNYVIFSASVTFGNK